MHEKNNIKSTYFTLLKINFFYLKVFFTPTYALSIDLENKLFLSNKRIQ